MKSTNNNAKMTLTATELQAIIASAVASALSQSSVPATSAKLVSRVPVAPMVKSPTKSPVKSVPQPTASAEVDPNEIRIGITAGMVANRLKFPSRIFDRNGVAYVDGVKYTAQPNDQNRSTKIGVGTYGLKEGQTLIVSRENPRSNKWATKVSGKGVASVPAVVARVAPAKSAPKVSLTQIAAKIAPKAVKAAPVKAVTEKEAYVPVFNRADAMNIKSLIAATAKLALAGYGAGVENTNLLPIEGLEADARVFLSSRESSAFRSARKKLGVSLRKAVEMLNDEVYG